MNRIEFDMLLTNDEQFMVYVLVVFGSQIEILKLKILLLSKYLERTYFLRTQ